VALDLFAIAVAAAMAAAAHLAHHDEEVGAAHAATYAAQVVEAGEKHGVELASQNAAFTAAKVEALQAASVKKGAARKRELDDFLEDHGLGHRAEAFSADGIDSLLDYRNKDLVNATALKGKFGFSGDEVAAYEASLADVSAALLAGVDKHVAVHEAEDAAAKLLLEEFRGFLRAHGLAEYAADLAEHGIDTLGEWQDSILVNEDMLVNEIGMAAADLPKWRASLEHVPAAMAQSKFVPHNLRMPSFSN